MRSVTILWLLAAISFSFPFLVANSQADSTAVELPKAEDLSALAEASNKQHLPILLMYSADDCEYCDLLEKDVIRPMMLSGELGKKVVFRKVMVDSISAIKDFRGQSIFPDEFAYTKGVQVTPTLQFVDENGEELVPKLIGYQGNDFFSAYLDTAISGSKEILLKK
jgi:thioredoxin-related protein